MTENNRKTLFTRTKKTTKKDVDTGKQARKFRIDENGNIRTGNPSAHWLPDVKFTEEIGGTSFDRPGVQKMLDEVEAGHVAVIIVKDLSRFGRNSAMIGMYTNITFAKYGVRFIAINDNFDTINPNSVDNDFAGIRNWFNEFYARDTSRKIRAVKKAKGERGEHMTSIIPYGYKKDPENPKQWVVDEEAAEVVRLILNLCMGRTRARSDCNRTQREKNSHAICLSGKRRAKNTVKA